MERPKQLENVDLSGLRNICEEYMDAVEHGHVHDLTHYMFEEVINTFYGKIAWTYINKRT